MTSVALRTPPSLKTARHQIQFWKQASAHFRKKGWFERLFNYLWDEPARSQFPAMLELGAIVHRADPAIRNLVTAPLHDDWTGIVDIWTPVVNCFEQKAGPHLLRSDGFPRGLRDGALQAESNCGGTSPVLRTAATSSAATTFAVGPTYMIDDSLGPTPDHGPKTRRTIGGELYFNTNEAYAKERTRGPTCTCLAETATERCFIPACQI